MRKSRLSIGFELQFFLQEWSVHMMSSPADSTLVCFFVQAPLGVWPAAGSGAFPARELSTQERVSYADSSLVHFLVKSRQIKRAARDLFRNKIDNGIHRSGGVPRKRESRRDIDSRGTEFASRFARNLRNYRATRKPGSRLGSRAHPQD